MGQANQIGFFFYPGDYLRDTQCLSENAQVAYDRIMCEHVRNICVSRQQFNFFTKKLTPSEKDDLMHVLEEKNGNFQIKWVADSVKNRMKYVDSRRKNRLGKKEDTSSTCDNHMKSYDYDMEKEIEKEIEIVKEPEKEKVDYQKIADDFNRICASLPQVQKLTDKRRKSIRARINEHGLAEVYNAFKITAKSNFLNGNNERGWAADFDWIFSPSNFLKILEGRYENRNGKAQGKPSRIDSLMNKEKEIQHGNFN